MIKTSEELLNEFTLSVYGKTYKQYISELRSKGENHNLESIEEDLIDKSKFHDIYRKQQNSLN